MENFAQFSTLSPPKVIVNREDDQVGNRFYWWIEQLPEGIKVRTGVGITTLLSSVMPTSLYLTNWKIGTPNWEQILDRSAAYGTMMHVMFCEWLTKRFVSKEFLESARKLADNLDMPEKDLLAFIRFCEDYQVKPLLIEAMLISPEFKGEYYCQTIDLLCELWVEEDTIAKEFLGVYKTGARKGQPKMKEVKIKTSVKKIANIDFKSNFMEKDRKTFYDSHFMQLIAARRAVEANYDMKVDIIANWAPNNWRSEPSYTFKIWDTTERDNKRLDAYLDIAKINGLFTPKGMKFIAGEFSEGTTSKSYELLNYEEYIRKYKLPEEGLF